ncbi:unnamed protein product [Owenia fusiformis]|uniref:Uncharacterized protein n=1 Tax=Owenia fusiformis TaxID=6347 RepID=A0A8J1Y3X8_OWEFU|nr:unnamed protein product [Owenia fusiformis]
MRRSKLIAVSRVRLIQRHQKMSLVDLGKRLLESAKIGDTDDVRSLMANGAPFTTDWLGTSPLHFAARFGHIKTAEVLLRAGISRDARTKVDRTPLHIASQEGHSDIVELLVKQGADIEAKDMLKMTPLQWSVEKGHINVMNTLLRHGADTTCENKFDQNAIDIATFNGRLDIVSVLQLAKNGQFAQLVDSNPEMVVKTTMDDITTDLSPSTAANNRLNSGTDEQNEDNSSTAVLATLAALAEATAPLGTSTTVDTSWLENQATVVTTADSDSTAVPSSDSGPTFTLTEAGKLALNHVKHTGENIGENSTLQVTDINGQKVLHQIIPGEVSTENTENDVTVETSVDSSMPLVVAMASEDDGTQEFHVAIQESDDEPGAKRARTSSESEPVLVQNSDLQSQVEDLKNQLKQKQLEADTYRRQLRKSK